jgi:hypothetical protein
MGWFFKSPREKMACALKRDCRETYNLMRDMVRLGRGKHGASMAKLILPGMFLGLYDIQKRFGKYDPDDCGMRRDFDVLKNYAQLVSCGTKVPYDIFEHVECIVIDFSTACRQASSTDEAIGNIILIMITDENFQPLSPRRGEMLVNHL